MHSGVLAFVVKVRRILSTHERGICRLDFGGLSLSGDGEKRTDRYLYIKDEERVEFERPDLIAV